LVSAEALDVRAAPSWSPDQKWLAVAGYEGDERRLFKVSVESGTSVPLISGLVTNPEWAPDGRSILYRERQGPSFTVKAVKPDGSPAAIPDLTIGVTASDGYRFIPDTPSIVALLGDVPAQNFWLVNLNTGVRRQLTAFKSGHRIRSFDISSEGKQILFDRWREDSDVVLIDRNKR
jgi:Tol biopolymer transport system component